MNTNEEAPLTTNQVLARLTQYRALDAPTHGGKLLSYVYDSGLADIDGLAREAALAALPINGLDPTTFKSVAKMEADLIAFAKKITQANTASRFKLSKSGWRQGKASSVQGTVTSGGTESCLLAVKAARDFWRAQQAAGQQLGEQPLDQQQLSKTRFDAPLLDTPRFHTPRLVIAQTAHAAFQKAAHYFGLKLDIVPVSADGVLDHKEMIARLGPDVALVVVSAPSYPTAQLDPIREVAHAAKQLGISCHVDACIGGFALAWWAAPIADWNFAVPGVTSISLDLHKFGYAPKGASVLLQRGLARHRATFFATTRWPGYPVVNPTMLGSRSAVGLAAAWAITQHLGDAGYRELTAKAEEATHKIVKAVASIKGLRVIAEPVGPLLALASDDAVLPADRVDAHHLADKMRARGFLLQHQPGLTQTNGVRIAHSVHLTVTPVTLEVLPELVQSLTECASEVRGKPRANPKFELFALKALGLLKPNASISPSFAALLLRVMGVGGKNATLPGRMAPMMSILEELPAGVAEPLLIEIIARLSQP